MKKETQTLELTQFRKKLTSCRHIFSFEHFCYYQPGARNIVKCKREISQSKIISCDIDFHDYTQMNQSKYLHWPQTNLKERYICDNEEQRSHTTEETQKA